MSHTEPNRAAATAGFTLVEVIVGMLILTVGLLALAGTTGAVFTQLRIAERRTERMAAVQQGIEQLYAVSFDNLATTCSSMSQKVGSYTLTCSSTAVSGTNDLRQVVIVSTGPGYRAPEGWRTNVADTFAVRIARAR